MNCLKLWFFALNDLLMTLTSPFRHGDYWDHFYIQNECHNRAFVIIKPFYYMFYGLKTQKSDSIETPTGKHDMDEYSVNGGKPKH